MTEQLALAELTAGLDGGCLTKARPQAIFIRDGQAQLVVLENVAGLAAYVREARREPLSADRVGRLGTMTGVCETASTNAGSGCGVGRGCSSRIVERKPVPRVRDWIVAIG